MKRCRGFEVLNAAMNSKITAIYNGRPNANAE